MEKSKLVRIEYGMDAMVVVKDYIWGALSGANLLVKIDIKTGAMEMIARFPKQQENEIYLYSEVFYYKNILVFIPKMAKDILTYNIITKQFDSIALTSEISGIDNKCMHGIQYKEKVYIFPHKAHAIIKISLDSLELQYFNAPIKKIDERNSKENNNDYFDCLVHENEYVYAGCGGKSSDILKYSLENDSYEIIDSEIPFNSEIPINGIGCGFYNNEFTLASSYVESKTYLKMKNNPYFELDELNGLLLYNAILCHGSIYLFGYNCSANNTIQKFDIKEKKISKIGDLHDGIHKAVYHDGKIYAVNSICSAVYEIDVKTDDIRKQKIFLGNDELASVCKDIEKKMYEEPEVTLKEFLDEIV